MEMDLPETTVYVLHSPRLNEVLEPNGKQHTHIETLNVAEAQAMQVDLYRKRGITATLEGFTYQPKNHGKKPRK